MTGCSPANRMIIQMEVPVHLRVSWMESTSRVERSLHLKSYEGTR